MQKEFQLAVDIEKKILTPSFEVNTLDLKTIKLKITITKGMTLVDLTDITVRMSIRKPDGNVIFQDCQVTNAKGGQVEIILENQAYVIPGSYSAEIMCFKGTDKVAVTGSFSYRSIRGIMDDKAVESKSEFIAITGMIENVESIVNDLKENGTGIDAQARQEVQEVNIQLEEKANNLNERGVNVMRPPVPLVAAKGDGIMDDYEAIQNIINYAYDNSIGSVIIPGGEFRISKPLYVWSGNSYGAKAIELIGINKNTSKIIKTTHNGTGDGSVYNSTDAIIIVTGKNKDSSVNYNVKMKNLGLNTLAADGIKSEYAVYVKYDSAETVFEDIACSGLIGFRFDGDMWQSSFKGLLMNVKKKGFSMGKSGTSILLERSYVLHSEEIAYELRGEYCFGNNLAADGCKGVIYGVSFGRWAIAGLGTESPEATNVIKVVNGSLDVTNIKSYALTSDEAVAIASDGNSRIKISGGIIGNGTTPTVRNSKLYDTAVGGVISISDVYVVDIYSKNPSWGDVGSYTTLKDTNSTEITLKDGKYRPFIGFDRTASKRNLDSHHQTQNITAKAIFLDVGNTPTTVGKSSIDVSWSKGGYKGDLFLANDPKAISGLGWVVTENEGGFLRDNTFTKIPLILSGTTANRPTTLVTVGTQYFDTTLGKPIWYKGSNVWVDGTGASV